jgi:hypothetical protein
MFIDPRNGTRIVADFVVSHITIDKFDFLPTFEPFLVRDVKTGEGGLTPNQKQVYPYILAGGKVIPIGENAAWAGFDIGEPTSIGELYVGSNPPSGTTH